MGFGFPCPFILPRMSFVSTPKRVRDGTMCRISGSLFRGLYLGMDERLMIVMMMLSRSSASCEKCDSNRWWVRTRGIPNGRRSGQKGGAMTLAEIMINYSVVIFRKQGWIYTYCVQYIYRRWHGSVQPTVRVRIRIHPDRRTVEDLPRRSVGQRKETER